MDKQEEGRLIDQAQRIAEENERKIVRFTNIDREDFTHSFRGISITVRKGESYLCRFPEGDHLATHLARKMIAREKKSRPDPDYKGSVLYTKEEVEGMKAKILSTEGSEVPERFTPEEERKRDLESIKEKYAPATTSPPQQKAPDITKADIIRDLKARGIEPDVKKTKEELLAQLIEAEAKK